MTSLTRVLVCRAVVCLRFVCHTGFGIFNWNCMHSSFTVFKLACVRGCLSKEFGSLSSCKPKVSKLCVHCVDSFYLWAHTHLTAFHGPLLRSFVCRGGNQHQRFRIVYFIAHLFPRKMNLFNKRICGSQPASVVPEEGLQSRFLHNVPPCTVVPPA